MTAHPSRPDLIGALGFDRHAEILEARVKLHRTMGGNWLMYGDPEAAQDKAAANSLRSASKLLRAALASEPEPQPVAEETLGEKCAREYLARRAASPHLAEEKKP
ncbi:MULTISPECIES: hypothetical protein [unclassified Aureimonas]|uniref:hypothetical protein n=1 Tax=unclassified Aureimonas TaxID=2615206 RepID=UPI0006FF149E|nr:MULTISPECIES: hypothetical protein [unclassified Aureimonas]KQT52170.1 hypothetical protein ASG62_16055 [Aureimonas sp. Leaf427]KQT70597.1 hypothetical protein ASG54_21895 [Aureimonas sp. Leaf460]